MSEVEKGVDELGLLESKLHMAINAYLDASRSAGLEDEKVASELIEVALAALVSKNISSLDIHNAVQAACAASSVPAEGKVQEEQPTVQEQGAVDVTAEVASAVNAAEEPQLSAGETIKSLLSTMDDVDVISLTGYLVNGVFERAIERHTEIKTIDWFNRLCEYVEFVPRMEKLDKVSIDHLDAVLYIVEQCILKVNDTPRHLKYVIQSLFNNYTRGTYAPDILRTEIDEYLRNCQVRPNIQSIIRDIDALFAHDVTEEEYDLLLTTLTDHCSQDELQTDLVKARVRNLVETLYGYRNRNLEAPQSENGRRPRNPRHRDNTRRQRCNLDERGYDTGYGRGRNRRSIYRDDSSVKPESETRHAARLESELRHAAILDAESRRTQDEDVGAQYMRHLQRRRGYYASQHIDDVDDRESRRVNGHRRHRPSRHTSADQAEVFSRNLARMLTVTAERAGLSLEEFLQELFR